MSARLDTSVERVDGLRRYPKCFAAGLVIRPMKAADEAALLAFFKRVPVDERQLFQEDVTQPAVLRGWIRDLDSGRVLHLLAIRGARIVAHATLRHDSGGWARHLGRMRLTIDADRRRQGLARQLTLEFISLAEPLGLAILEAEVLDVQKPAMLFFESMGFLDVATLPRHAIDLEGRVHDMRVYALTVRLPEGLAPEARLTEAEADIGGG
jgi:ribosomal protein S18 acetylase RimI-like enzyme